MHKYLLLFFFVCFSFLTSAQVVIKEEIDLQFSDSQESVTLTMPFYGS